MTRRPFRRGGLSSLAFAMALGGWQAPAQANGREIRCESHGMRHAYCPIGSHGTVRLMETHGAWACREGESYGIETEGIWVDSGCKGTFWVDDKHSSHNADRNAAIAAVVGLGVLAAIAASHDKTDEGRGAGGYQAVPSWAIGSYHGYSPRDRAELTLDVGSSGRIDGRMRGTAMHGRWQPGDSLRLEDGRVFRAARTNQGLRLTQTNDGSNVLEFYRD